MSNQVCTTPCFWVRRWRPGDIMESELFEKIPEKLRKCFKGLRSKNAAAMEAEIEEVVPEMADRKRGRPKAVSISEMHGKLPDQFA